MRRCEKKEQLKTCVLGMIEHEHSNTEDTFYCLAMLYLFQRGKGAPDAAAVEPDCPKLSGNSGNCSGWDLWEQDSGGSKGVPEDF